MNREVKISQRFSTDRGAEQKSVWWEILLGCFLVVLTLFFLFFQFWNNLLVNTQPDISVCLNRSFFYAFFNLLL